MDEPTLRVGLALRRTEARITLQGAYTHGGVAIDGPVVATLQGDRIVVVDPSGATLLSGPTVSLVPGGPDAFFVLHAMTVGVDFHWEHEQDLSFGGALSLESRGETFDVVNEVGLEAYLRSVISSEMSATCPPALLRAHAVISRSWLLAQIQDTVSGYREGPVPGPPPVEALPDGGRRVVMWYDREDHQHFDVCADDHCQRYQGLSRTSTQAAVDAVARTEGLVLMHDGRVCDARFSKSCGGMTEVFSSAWGDIDVPYLAAFGDTAEVSWDLPLTDEAHAVAFIEGSPGAYCNTTDRGLLDRILPALDHATTQFFRWTTTVSAAEIQGYVRDKLGVDLGAIASLTPLERGPSGRLTRLEIRGADGRIEVGKELEIRRVLSASHLYSSAFVVKPEDTEAGRVFHLRGAGWGHGVGLCQIGAAVMAQQDHDHDAILGHYFPGATLQRIY